MAGWGIQVTGGELSRFARWENLVAENGEGSGVGTEEGAGDGLAEEVELGGW